VQSKVIRITVAGILSLLAVYLAISYLSAISYLPLVPYRPLVPSWLADQVLDGSEKAASIRFLEMAFSTGSISTLEVTISGGGGALRGNIHKVVVYSNISGLETDVLCDSQPCTDYGTITKIEPSVGDFYLDAKRFNWKVPENEDLVGSVINFTVRVGYTIAYESAYTLDSYFIRTEEVKVPLKIRILTNSEVDKALSDIRIATMLHYAKLAAWAISVVSVAFLVRSHGDLKLARVFALVCAVTVFGVLLMSVGRIAHNSGDSNLIELAMWGGMLIWGILSYVYYLVATNQLG